MVHVEGVANGHHPLADADGLRVAERQIGEIAIGLADLEQGQIGGFVTTDDLGVELEAIREFDHDLVRVFDDVVVGDELTIAGDDKPGTGRSSNRGLVQWRLGASEELVERILRHPRAVVRRVLNVFDGDRNHRWHDSVGQRGEVRHRDRFHHRLRFAVGDRQPPAGSGRVLRRSPSRRAPQRPRWPPANSISASRVALFLLGISDRVSVAARSRHVTTANPVPTFPPAYSGRICRNGTYLAMLTRSLPAALASYMARSAARSRRFFFISVVPWRGRWIG